MILQLVLPVEPLWKFMMDDLGSLTDRAVEVRYPGMCADDEDAKSAIEIAQKVRELVRGSFGLGEK
jgi:HEPN domain-containing protein